MYIATFVVALYSYGWDPVNSSVWYHTWFINICCKLEYNEVNPLVVFGSNWPEKGFIFHENTS